MAKNFKILKDALDKKLTPEQREESRLWVERELAAIRLNQMRRHRELTQVSLANRLGIDQGSVSRLEKQTDMHLSTLRAYIEAAGGRLEVQAVFPGETISLTFAQANQ